MPSRQVLLNAGEWVKVTASDDYGSIRHHSGNYGAIYIKSDSEPSSIIDTSMPVFNATRMGEGFAYASSDEGGDTLWARSVGGDIIIVVTPSFSAARLVYNNSGDSYTKLRKPVVLGVGDVLRFKFIMPTVANTTHNVQINTDTASSCFITLQANTSTLGWSEGSFGPTVNFDGRDIVEYEALPEAQDGLAHAITITATNACSFDLIGANPERTAWGQNPVYDLTVTRSSESTPFFSMPIDDQSQYVRNVLADDVRYRYWMDGTTYAIVNIPLEAGDGVEIDFVAPLSITSFDRYLIHSSTEGVGGRVWLGSSSDILNASEYTGALLDGSANLTCPLDGDIHTLTLIATSSTVDLAVIGARATTLNFRVDFSITGLRTFTANSPNRNYLMDETSGDKFVDSLNVGELWVNPTVNSGWVDNGDGSYTNNGTSQYSKVSVEGLPDGEYLYSFRVKGQVGSGIAIRYNGVDYWQYANNPNGYEFSGTAILDDTNAGQSFSIQGDDGTGTDSFTIYDITLTQITDATIINPNDNLRIEGSTSDGVIEGNYQQTNWQNL